LLATGSQPATSTTGCYWLLIILTLALTMSTLMIEIVSSKGSNDTYMQVAMLVGVVAQNLCTKVLATHTQDHGLVALLVCSSHQ
jgi:hypothetical protein